VIISKFDLNGTTTSLANWMDLNISSLVFRASHPVRNGLAEIYNVEVNSSLTKRTASGALLWSKDTGLQWTVGQDTWDGVHLAGNSGQLARYDYDGNQVWLLSLASPCDSMVLDSVGNR